MGGIAVGPHCLLSRYPFFLILRPREGQRSPGVTQHKEGALPCAFSAAGQTWHHGHALGGSLGASRGVTWPEEPRETRLSPVLGAMVVAAPTGMPAPGELSFPMRVQRARGVEAAATRTRHSPRPVSMDLAIGVTRDGFSLQWYWKVSFKNKFKNLTKFHQLKD